MSPGRRSSPGGGSEGASRVIAATDSTVSQTAATPSFPLCADHAVVALVGLSTGGVRRHVYFNLPNAQRAVERAHSRGLSGRLILVRLLQVPVAPLAEAPSPLDGSQ